LLERTELGRRIRTVIFVIAGGDAGFAGPGPGIGTGRRAGVTDLTA
jgi:hypothetical protein